MTTAAPILLTPGPLTTSNRTRQAMMVDWGSWDDRFNALTASVCSQLLAILHGTDSHHCVPLQGSGTFAVEAAIGTLVPRDGKVLVLINGAYGKRLAKICEVLGRDFSTFETAEDQPTTAADVDRLLRADTAITHVALIHCETSIGMQEFVVTLWTILRWPLIVILLMFAVALMYYVMPDVEQKFRFITPGSVLAVVVWPATSTCTPTPSGT